MFTKDTVFILGAGASWHYGYPTGEELVKKVIQKADYACRYLEYSTTSTHRVLPIFLGVEKPDSASVEEIKTTFRLAFAQCSALKKGLEQVNPPVIDYYLGWNPGLQKIGKLLIAWVILECEYTHRQNGANLNRKELLINSPHEDERQRAKGLDLKRYKDDDIASGGRAGGNRGGPTRHQWPKITVHGRKAMRMDIGQSDRARRSRFPRIRSRLLAKLIMNGGLSVALPMLVAV
jgi:hypothetical protein